MPGMPGKPIEFRAPRRDAERPPNFQSAYRKAAEITAQHSLKLESFIRPDGSNKRVVENNLAYVEKRRSGFKDLDRQGYVLAKTFEAALFEGVNKSNWFGDHVTMVMPSEYDDLANGIDGVLEIQEGEGRMSHIGLGIDVTYNQEPDKKFQIIKEQIDEGRLGLVKYFRSSDGTYEGSLENLPRAIVILKAGDARNIVRDWDENTQSADTVHRKIILCQLEIQLEAYQAYAEQLEQADEERYPISKFFAMALRNISALLAEITRPEELAHINNHPSIKLVKDQLDQLGLGEAPLAQAA